MAIWQIDEAKNRFRELLEDAHANGPQVIAEQGTEQAVVLSMEEYRVLAAQALDLKACLLGGPKVDELTLQVFERGRDSGRTIEL
jgi:antitoxin Phd